MLFYPTRPQHSLVNDVGPVGGSYHEDHPAVVDAIELVEQSVNHSFGDLIALVLPFWRQSVKLVKENYARS